MPYSIIATNKQGASKGFSGDTQGEINRWLSTWSDPENLSCVVKDVETGETVAEKSYGKKRLQWYARNEAAAALGSIKSARKAKSSAENGKLGGRPKSKDKGAA